MESTVDPHWLSEWERGCDAVIFEAKALLATPSSTVPKQSRTSERGTTEQATTILGLKPRKLQSMAQRGEIPGAAKLGRQWTYDLTKLRRFVEQQEQVCQNAKPRPDATGAVEFFGEKFKLKGGNFGGRLRQMIQQSQKRVGKRAKSER